MEVSGVTTGIVIDIVAIERPLCSGAFTGL